MDRDRLMYRKAMEYIRAEPLRYVGVSLLRLGYTWRPMPRASAGGFGGWHAVIMLVSWGPVFVLAIVWALRAQVWRDPRQWAILLAIAWVLVVSAAVRGAVRYRAPVEPFFVVYAAAAVAPLLRRWIPDEDADR